MKVSSLGVCVAITATMVILLAMACSDGSRNALTPQEALPVAPSTDTPSSTQNGEQPPVVNVQFVGGDDLSEENKLSLADLIERIQGAVVQLDTGVGGGSGFIMSADGLVVTNEHVVGIARSVTVWSSNGRSYKGEVLERNCNYEKRCI